MDLNLKIKKKLINHLTIGIVVSNDQGQIIFTNKNFKEMTGYTETEINTIDSWYKKAYPNQESRKKAKELFNYDKKMILVIEPIE
jgi:PAS domain S-box-containing protein